MLVLIIAVTGIFAEVTIPYNPTANDFARNDWPPSASRWLNRSVCTDLHPGDRICNAAATHCRPQPSAFVGVPSAGGSGCWRPPISVA